MGLSRAISDSWILGFRLHVTVVGLSRVARDIFGDGIFFSPLRAQNTRRCRGNTLARRARRFRRWQNFHRILANGSAPTKIEFLRGWC